MKKIAELQPYGTPKMTIYYDEKAKVNPYRVMVEQYVPAEYGMRHQKKQINRYADLASCVRVMAQYAYEHNEEGR